MMRPPSKHGLDRKYKPWRRGKASSERARRTDGDGTGGGGTRPLKRPTNASLRNQLRGQRRLLAKLEAKGDGDVAGVNERIAQLERDIAKYEATEREKKNAAKYHQVKFIERQKLARLEKSVKRQLQQLEQSDDGANATQTSALQRQLQRIVLDQLYVAFYPADVKYIALFANGTHRAADDARGARRRRGVWTRIRAGLLEEWGDEGTDGAADEGRRAKRARLEEAKAWVDLDAAKEALLSMPADAYPNDSWHSGAARAANEGKPAKAVAAKRETAPVAKKGPASMAKAEKAKTATDGRFALSKELDGMFRESTTGEDYERERKSEGESGSSDSSSEDDSSSSEEDDADPLGGFDGKKEKGPEKEDTKKGAEVKSTPDDGSSSSSSSSSSCESSSSSEDSDSSDSDSDEEPPPMNQRQPNPGTNPKERDGDDGGDDFFAAGAVSTEEAFAQAQKNPRWNRSRHFGDDGNGEPRRDKSRGFSTQNQSRREFRAHKERQKRQRFR